MFNLLRLLKIKFEGELTLKDGTPIKIDGNLETGAKINFITSEGVEKPLPQGTYTLSTGEQIDVDDKSVITNITATAVNNPSPDNPAQQVQNSNVIPAGLPNSTDAVKAEAELIIAEKEELKSNKVPAADSTTPTPTDTITPVDDTTSIDTNTGTTSIEELSKRVDELEKIVKSIQDSLTTTNNTMLASKEEIEKIKTKATFAKEIINIPSSDTNEGTSNVADILKTYLNNK